MKTALVTGGSRGIGRACVKALTDAGYETTFIYKEDDCSAESLGAETGALSIKCDVSDGTKLKEAIKDLPAMDAVVVNAGICNSGLLQDLSREEWEEMRGANLDGAIYTLQAVLSAMISEKKGSIIIVSSVWGITGASCEAGYSATKAALIGLGKSLAKELGPSGIRVNVICPGVIDTDMNKGYTEAELADLRKQIPLGDMGSPEEVAALVSFLAGDEASYITGQTIGIDGGFMV